MRSVVIGTAGHIDHGKTTLLRALTGIDAERLPEERARGMTIDVGFAHLDLDNGSTLDFVDVPGHDRLVGNMLVGAGEIDAVLLVVAADDGPRAQTIEHLELLDALGHDLGLVAITKIDVVAPERVAEVEAAIRTLIDGTGLRGSQVVGASGTTGRGVAELRAALVALRDRVLERDAQRPHGPVRLAVDRAFTVKGRGDVVTGTLRGGSLVPGTALRVEPGGGAVRVKEVQVRHGRAAAADGGRTGLNVTIARARGEDGGRNLRRGQVLTSGAGVVASTTWLAVLTEPVALEARVAALTASPVRPRGRGAERTAFPPRPGTTARLHLGTQQAEATIRPIASTWWALADPSLGKPAPSGRAVLARLRTSEPVAGIAGEHAVLRNPATSRVIAGARLVDPVGLRGPARRRATSERAQALVSALVEASSPGALEDALLDLHGWLSRARREAIRGALDGTLRDPSPELAGVRFAPEVEDSLRERALVRVRDAVDGVPAAELRADLIDHLRGLVTIGRADQANGAAAVTRLVERMVATAQLARHDDRLLDPARRPAADAALDAAMDRLEAALDADVPPGLADAMVAASCPPAGLRALEASGRIVRVDDDLAWRRSRYEELAARAVRLASSGPLTPAAFRDAIGGNRRVVMPLLEDFGRKGILRRTDAGHLPGPRAAVRA